MSDTELVVINEGEIVTCPSKKQLPFDSSETSRIGGGGYGSVYREAIAIRHCKYKQKASETLGISNESPLPVARKWYPYTPDFDREYGSLHHLNTSPHRHQGVIRELAVLIYDDHQNLLLPMADNDLEKIQILTDFSTLGLKDLLKQASNVADALSWLHSGIRTPGGKILVACHMDLNPSSILVFHNEAKSAVGSWKITDFSTSTLTTERGDQLLSAPKIVALVYSAPEIQEQPELNKASPECDVWSLGCILFEILLGYVDGREEFIKWRDRWNNMPSFYDEETGERVLSSRVKRWITRDVPAESCRNSSCGIVQEVDFGCSQNSAHTETYG